MSPDPRTSSEGGIENPFLFKTVDVALRDLAMIGQSLSFRFSHLGSKHKKRPQDGQNEKDDKASQLQLERQQALPSVQDTARDQPRQHGALGKEDWTKGVGTLNPGKQAQRSYWGELEPDVGSVWTRAKESDTR